MTLPTYSLHPYRPNTRVQRTPIPLNAYDDPAAEEEQEEQGEQR